MTVVSSYTASICGYASSFMLLIHFCWTQYPRLVSRFVMGFLWDVNIDSWDIVGSLYGLLVAFSNFSLQHQRSFRRPNVHKKPSERVTWIIQIGWFLYFSHDSHYSMVIHLTSHAIKICWSKWFAVIIPSSSKLGITTEAHLSTKLLENQCIASINEHYAYILIKCFWCSDAVRCT